VDGNSEDEVFSLAENIGEIALDNNAIDVFVADNKAKQEIILDIRSHVYESLKKYMLEDLDICIPRASIGDYVAEVKNIAEKYDMWIPSYGHAGDGNVHDHIMSHKWENGKWIETPNWKEKFHNVIKEIYEIGKKYNGILSGEHGIGAIKKEFLPDFVDSSQLTLMKQIKKIFDPNYILNPGKVLVIEKV